MLTWNCVNRVNGSNMHLTGNGIYGSQNGMHVISAKVDGIANDIAIRNICKSFYPSYEQWRSDDNYLHMCFILRVCTLSEMTNIKMFNQSNQWDIYIYPPVHRCRNIIIDYRPTFTLYISFHWNWIDSLKHPHQGTRPCLLWLWCCDSKRKNATLLWWLAKLSDYLCHIFGYENSCTIGGICPNH